MSRGVAWKTGPFGCSEDAALTERVCRLNGAREGARMRDVHAQVDHSDADPFCATGYRRAPASSTSTIEFNIIRILVDNYTFDQYLNVMNTNDLLLLPKSMFFLSDFRSISFDTGVSMI